MHPMIRDRRVRRRRPRQRRTRRRHHPPGVDPGVHAVRDDVRQRRQRLVLNGRLPVVRRRLLVPGHRQLRRHLVELVQRSRLRDAPHRRQRQHPNRRHHLHDALRTRPEPPTPSPMRSGRSPSTANPTTCSSPTRSAATTSATAPTSPPTRRLDHHLPRTRTTRRSPQSNWLPTLPAKTFTANLRLYLPPNDVHNGTSTPPPLIPA